jgi:hypothetical protein
MIDPRRTLVRGYLTHEQKQRGIFCSDQELFSSPLSGFFQFLNSTASTAEITA